nr:acetyltransferase [Neobacillus sp. YIM B06451]
MIKLCIIGQGGHSKVVEDIALSLDEYTIAARLDDKFKCVEEKDGVLYGPIILAKELSLNDKSMKFVLAVGNNEARKKISGELSLPLERYAVLAHPTAVVSMSAKIGNGTVIMPNCIVNAAATVGNHAILNTGSVIEHDTILGDYTHVSPNAALTGGVGVGEGTQIGVGATVIPGIQIGDWCMVGAGATVINPVNNFETVAGTPAKPITKVRV